MKIPVFKKLLLAVLLSCCAYQAARADKTDFKVNDDARTAEQNNPRVAVTGNGQFVIVWVDKREGNSDIYFQRFDSEGDPINGNLKINDDSVYAYQSDVALAVDHSGLFSAVWKDFRNGIYPFDSDIYFQRFDSALQKSGVNRNITTAWPDTLVESPDIALSIWGNGVVVWSDYRNLNWDIYGQLIAANGSLIGSNFKINTDDGSAQQYAPRVSYSPEGWFVVTWYDRRFGNDDIYVQRFDSLGTPLGINVKVNSDNTETRQAFPDVAADGAGHFTVVWVDWRNGVYPANPDIYYRKYDTLMTPLFVEQQVNADYDNLAQREPVIASDYLGNLAVIWSDSSASSWDILGQMFDVSGSPQGSNFIANHDSDSAQQRADVALDGKFRYVTWADKRSGNYDIYCSITQYNNPSLIPTPTALQFVMTEGGALPESQTLSITYNGYNPLNYRITTSHDWFTVAPSTGVVPAEVTVEITTDTLPFGTYLGTLTLIDEDFHDSSVVVSVRLDVTAPALEISEDTVMFELFAGIDENFTQAIAVTNGGGGDFTWTASEDSAWLTVAPLNGFAGDSVSFTVNTLNLEAGTYTSPVEIDAGEIVNSPDTVWVIVVVSDNQPYLIVAPDSLYIETPHPETFDTLLVVTNGGVSILNWHLEIHDPWLIADPNSGFGDDTVRFTINAEALTPGIHNTTVTFIDSGSFNISVTVPVVLDYFEAREDTLLIQNVNVNGGTEGILPIEMKLGNDLSGMTLPLKFDTSAIQIDSILFDELPAYYDISYQVNSSQGTALINIASQVADSFMTAGEYLLTELYFTAGSQALFGIVDTTWTADNIIPQVITPLGRRIIPTVISGGVEVQVSTDVSENGNELIPTTFTLEQNYPNPFNLETTISYALPIKSHVTLDIYNILGQKIASLVESDLASGYYKAVWNGQQINGSTAPSGIYFCNLRAGDISLVRKLILIK